MTELSQAPPVIDIGSLVSDSSNDPSAAVFERIHDACLKTGFFVAVGHGIDAEMSAMFDQAHSFFDQTQAQKEQTPRVNRYGFIPQRDQAIDSSRQLGNTEYLDLGLANEIPLPELAGFEAAVRAYQQSALRVGRKLLDAIAQVLGAEPTFFADRMIDPQCRLRLLHYLAATPEPDGSLPVPTTTHTDYGGLTLLATDGVPGLEVKPIDRPWTPVDAPAGSLVVNLGDMLARWTNDVYRSTPHRVVGPAHVDRMSIPFFINPNPATIIECIPSCVSEDRPCVYEPVTAGQFLAARIDSSAEPYVNSDDGPARRIEDFTVDQANDTADDAAR